MNTSGADGSPIGGGEILKFWGNADIYNNKSPYLDNGLVAWFDRIPLVKYAIIALLLVLMIIALMRLFKIKSIFKGKAISRELNHMEMVRKHDRQVIKANKRLRSITAIVNNSIFAQSQTSAEYLQYNLNRVGLEIPGGARILKADEFNALVVFYSACCIAVSILIALFINSILGWVLGITTIIVASTMPMIVLRIIVSQKDSEIKANFSDYYLMLHYVLLANAKTPLGSIMKSYAKTTESKEMQRYIDVCIHYIDTYGDYEATRHIAKEYREVPQVCKLMRLIRQANEGGEIEADLNGFRAELLSEKKYAIEKKVNKLVANANASFNILMIVLVQAVLSAMAIYITDLGMVGSLFGM